MPRRITLVRPSDMFKAMDDSMPSFINEIGMDDISSLNINIKEFEDRFELSTKVPGFKKDEIDISFTESNIVLEGKTKVENENKDGEYVLQEYSEQSFKRSLSLPGKINIDRVEATLVDGILKISLPKSENIAPKKVTIN